MRFRLASAVSTGGAAGAGATTGSAVGAAAGAAAGAAVATPDPDASATGAATGGAASLSDVERWALHVVNREYERSKATKWKRLFPSARSSEYYAFLDEARTLHRLPFDV